MRLNTLPSIRRESKPATSSIIFGIRFRAVVFTICILSLLTVSCAAESVPPGMLRVIAIETFLADIAQNIAGSRFTVTPLLPYGVEPHAFQPSPQDFVALEESDIVIYNGAGLEGWFTNLLENSDKKYLAIESSAGLHASKNVEEEESLESDSLDDDHGHAHGGIDPHFWLDPISVIRYVENIRDGFSLADPGGALEYRANAELYIDQLRELDSWIRLQVESIPPDRRILVVDHKSLGYFSDRYGFIMIGAIIPHTDASASPTAKELAELIDHILEAGAPAIFLQTGTNPQLAQQISSETGIKIITGLLTHSITEPDGVAPTYIEMMKFNVTLILSGLKDAP